MMTYSEELRSVAEIAVALAGFAGIVVTLERGSSPAISRTNRARLRELLLASLGVAFFAFMPALLAGAAEDDHWAWRTSQLLFAAYQAFLMFLFLRSAGLTQFVQAGTRTEWVSFPLGVSVIFLQVATVFGFFPNQLCAVYFLALLWLLFIAGQDFVVLLLNDQ